MHNLQALQLPEKRKGRVFVEALIQEPAGQPVPFSEYLREDRFLYELRRRVNVFLVTENCSE